MTMPSHVTMPNRTTDEAEKVCRELRQSKNTPEQEGLAQAANYNSFETNMQTPSR